MSTTPLPQQCTDCGFVYDPADYGGVPLIDRDDWECPGVNGACGATVDKFEILEPLSPLDDDEDTEEDSDDAFDASLPPVRVGEVSAEKADKAIKDIATMVDDGDLILRPDWQRYYVWSNKQASLLIESLFLKLPIPLIYIAEEDDGTFSVIDGQQRLTALYEFYRNKHIDPTITTPVRLTGLEVLRHLEGKTFNDLDPKDQRFLKYRELQMIRLKSDSDPNLKLKVFQRLNTGSVKLNAQELRNAAFMGPYNDELKKWAQNPKFLKMLRPDGKPDPRMLDVEMALRASAWMNRGWTALTNKNLGAFLNEEMRLGSTYTPKKLATIGRQFAVAVDLSYQTFGARAFRRYFPGVAGSPGGSWEMRQPNKAIFDVIMFGFTRRSKPQFWPHLEAIRESFVDLMATDARFQDAITSGTSDPRRVSYRFTTWLARLDELVDDEPNARSFSASLKETLFKADPTCKLCGQVVRDVDDAHVHHIDHYWRGGKTIPSNAALAHRFCNLSEGGGS
jgi:hypothetical protein